MSLKDKIKAMDFMFFPLLFWRCIKDQPYRNLMKDVYRGNALVAKSYGDKNAGKCIYYVNFPAKYGSGLFVIWKVSLIAAAICEEYGMYPVINVEKGSSYYEKKYGENPFEYYFEPLSDVSVEDVFSSKMVIQHKDLVEPAVFKGVRGYDNLNRYIEAYAYYTSKYIKIKPDIAQRLEEDFSSLNYEKTLGVHIRGVEWGHVKGHPIPVGLEQYFDRIDSALNQYGFERIFIATDSEDTLQRCKERYGERIVFFDDVARTEIGSTKLVILDEKLKKEYSPFRMGYEVLRDMMALSSCSGLIAGFSQVSTAAQAFKLSRGENYMYKDLIQNKIQKHGIAPKDVVARSKKS